MGAWNIAVVLILLIDASNQNFNLISWRSNHDKCYINMSYPAVFSSTAARIISMFQLKPMSYAYIAME